MEGTALVAKYKSDQGTRFVHFLVDTVFYHIIIFAISFSVGIMILIINPESTILYDIEEIPPILDQLVTAIAVALASFGMETLTKGRSPGKYITGTQVVRIDGNHPDIRDYFIRNMCRLIPFDTLSFLGKKGFHDNLSKTRVVNKKAFEHEKNLISEIETIGIAEE